MARAIWSGSITFGLVSVPVKLHPAVAQKEVRFHMLHGKDGSRIRMKRFCAAEDREVPLGEIIVPEKAAAKAYRLLLEAMRRTGKVALGSFVLRTREALCCIRPLEEVLALSTMNRADEVVPVSSLEVPQAKATERELVMAEQLVASLAAPFEPGRYPDVHRERVLELVERKAEGEAVEAPEPHAAPAKVVSLADALSQSLAAARRRGDGGARRPGSSAGARVHRPAAPARAARKARRKKRP